MFVNSVFVFFPDEKDLFVHENKGGFIMKNSYQFVPLTLPCRVSDPEVQVKLLKPGNIEVPLENYAITFDPKIGFYIEFPSFQLVGMLQCAAILRNTVQETLNIYVNYIGNVYLLFTTQFHQWTIHKLTHKAHKQYNTFKAIMLIKK